MSSRTHSHQLQVIGAVLLLLVLGSALYLPFLRNPLVFDDEAFFFLIPFAYHATTPLGLNLRLPPYFTLAFTQMTWGSFPVWQDLSAHRILSLIFHSACVLALFKLIYDLLRAVRPDVMAGHQISGQAFKHYHACLLAFAGAAFFAVHPVTVYGAGYLVQRSIVMATLFSLLSMILFLRGLTRGNYADAVSAALFYSLAVLSKEHALLLPAAVSLIAVLAHAGQRFSLRYSTLYLAACVPAAILAVLLSMRVIGWAYEPHYGDVSAQLESIFGLNKDNLTLWSSMTIQAGLFFKYLSLWLWPDTSAMAIDMRVDFVKALAPARMFVHVMMFVLAAIASVYLLRRKGLAGLAGLGLLYTLILFGVEFSTMRFQEPFALYRSYLWAPGILIMVVAAVAVIPGRVVMAVLILVLPFLFYQAYDRLTTLSDPVHLWEDATAKLPSQPVPWGSRVLFNLGRAYLINNQVDKALAATDRCMADYPGTYLCYYGRAGIHTSQKEFELAISYFERALEVAPTRGILYHHIGMALEELGKMDEARSHYVIAAGLGFKGGDYQLMRLNSIEMDGAPPKSQVLK
jgi:protein O-mannosyl-transferase